jgi:ribosomal protein S30
MIKRILIHIEQFLLIKNHRIVAAKFSHVERKNRSPRSRNISPLITLDEDIARISRDSIMPRTNPIPKFFKRINLHVDSQIAPARPQE